jgi:hypothetical protein
VTAQAETEDCFIEIIRIGMTLKVSAIDPDSGLEVSISGPVSAGTYALSRIAARKLARRRERESPESR